MSHKEEQPAKIKKSTRADPFLGPCPCLCLVSSPAREEERVQQRSHGDGSAAPRGSRLCLHPPRSWAARGKRERESSK